MHALPNLSNFEAFRAWRADPSQWLPAALDIARGHGLLHANPHPFVTGTNLVVGLDGLVLKIFPPMLRAQFISERGSLSQLRGRVSVPIPEIVLEGERHVEGDDLGNGVVLHEISADGMVLDFKGQRFLYPRDGR